MWFRVDDGFVEHPKVLTAADQLGPPHGVARVVAVWLESGIYCTRQLTDGFVPARIVGRLVADDMPLEVAAALVAAGLWTAAPGGFRFHDWDQYQPNGAEIRDRRARDRVRKMSARNPRGIRVESARNPRGFRGGHLVPDPDPDPKDQDHKKEQCADARRSHKVLEKLAHGVLDARDRGQVVDLLSELASELKTRAAQARIAYDGRSITKALESAAVQRTVRRG